MHEVNPFRVIALPDCGDVSEAMAWLDPALRPHPFNGPVPLDQALFLPVLHRQDWVAVLDPASARILGFLPGDGFAVP